MTRSFNLTALLLLALAALAPAVRGELAVDPKLAWPGPDKLDKIMGDYEGTFTPASGPATPAFARVIAYLDGRYSVVLYPQPYPKEDPKNPKTRIELSGQAKPASAGATTPTLEYSGKVDDTEWSGTIKDGALTATGAGPQGGKMEMKYLVRHSPTEGQKPPEGAVVLLAFDGKTSPSLDAWQHPFWMPLAGGMVQVIAKDLTTKQKFGDMQLHLEFATPFMPGETGQGRANSGVYLQNRYELQVLDSFGVALGQGLDECGAIYKVAAPKVNACYPPNRWQTYDVTYRAARFDADCDVSELPLVKIELNGVTIHDGQWIDNPTPGSAPGHTKHGELRLQDHLNPMRFRNIWLVERNDLPYAPKMN